MVGTGVEPVGFRVSRAADGACAEKSVTTLLAAGRDTTGVGAAVPAGAGVAGVATAPLGGAGFRVRFELSTVMCVGPREKGRRTYNVRFVNVDGQTSNSFDVLRCVES